MHPSAQLIRVLLACAGSFVGSISSSGADNVSNADSSGLLLQKVMSGLPRYGEIQSTTAPTDSNTEVEPEITRLAPLVIVGRRKLQKFDELALLTERALKAAIRQRYGSQFQHWEEKRLQEAEKLQDYAGNLKLAGDHLESAAIQKEIDRLLVSRNSDWVSQGMDKIFNPRYR